MFPLQGEVAVIICMSICILLSLVYVVVAVWSAVICYEAVFCGKSVSNYYITYTNIILEYMEIYA